MCIRDRVYAVLEKTGTASLVIMKGGQPVETVKSEFGDYLDKVIYIPVIGLDGKDGEKKVRDYMTQLHPAAFELVYSDSSSPLDVYKRQVDPPMITDYDDDLDEEVVLQKGLESYFVTQFGEGDMDGTSWDQAMDVAGFRKLLSGSIDLSKSTIYMSQGKYVMSETGGLGVIIRKDIKAIKGGYSLSLIHI